MSQDRPRLKVPLSIMQGWTEADWNWVRLAIMMRDSGQLDAMEAVSEDHFFPQSEEPTYAHDAHCNTDHEAGPEDCPPSVEHVHGTPEEVLADMVGGYDAVNPPHYTRGPALHLGQVRIPQDQWEAWQEKVLWMRQLQVIEGHLYAPINAIDIMRCIADPRLATAFKYVWRLAFGGKREPGDCRNQRDIDVRDAESAAWYLTDFANNIPMFHN